MAEPIVFISRWRICQGKRAALEAMFAQAVGFIGSTKPRTALFAAYLWTDAMAEGSVRVYGEPELVAAVPGWFVPVERDEDARSHWSLREPELGIEAAG